MASIRVKVMCRGQRGLIVFDGPEIVDGPKIEAVETKEINMRFWPARLVLWLMRQLGFAVMFYPDHFGHQCSDVAMDLLKKKERLIYLAGIIPNRALRTIHEQHVTVLDIPGWLKRHLMYADDDSHCMAERMSRGFLAFNNTRDFMEHEKLTFTQEQQEYGKALLKRLRLEPGKYVCFHARDSNYGKVNHPAMFKERGDPGHITEESKAQSQRNMDFSDFFPTIRWLQTQGLTAVRLGADAELAYEANNLVDYASERPSLEDPGLADLYLMAHSRMFIGQNTGIQMLSVMYSIPSVLVNWYPYAPFSRPTANTVVTRVKRIKKNGQVFSEFDSRHLFDFMNWQHFYQVAEELEVIDNTPDEILDTVKWAMEKRLDRAA